MFHSAAMAGQFVTGGRVDVPLTLANGGLTLANQTDTATWVGLSYGAAADPNRFCIVGVTGEENTSGIISLTALSWGGVSFTRADLSSGSDGGVGVNSEVWYGVVPTGLTGDLVATLDDTAGGANDWDSIAISTFVTNMLTNNALVESGQFVRFGGGTSDTVSNLQTNSPGIAVAVGAHVINGSAFVSFSGNGSNGSFTKNVDIDAASDHRHAVWSEADTTSQTTEDFTMIGAGGGLVWTGVFASFD